MSSGGVFSVIVSIVLALLFACVMGLSSAAVLVADYMAPGRAFTEQARQTLFVCGIAGFLAALTAWWLQTLAAERGLFVRFVNALFTYTLAFGAIGGLLVVANNFISYPENNDFSLGGIYSASVGGFYTFALFVAVPLRIALAGLLLAAGLIIALVGPQAETTSAASR